MGKPMADETDFYATYSGHKAYGTPTLSAKNVCRFDREFWYPAQCSPALSVLEVGCGTGQFLLYLKEKGVGDFLGIDRDEALAAHVPAAVAENFRAEDVRRFLNENTNGRTFDRVVMFDVLEHFTPEEGVRLLKSLAGVLAPGGKVLVRVPNMASPWGAIYQYGDLTHRAAYTPDSMRQLARAAGFGCVRCYAQVRGSRSRRFLDGGFHAILGKVLMTPPEIWSANFHALLELSDR